MKTFITALSFVLLTTIFFPSLTNAQTPGAQGSTSNSSNNTPAAQESADDSTKFIPLTNLPGIKDVATSETLPSFFNNLYKLCIGAAAVIAILQIMRAGTYFMFNKGSIAHNEKGKSLLMNSILGLLLVLSPAIVFGIINPDILDLRLNFQEIELKDSLYIPGKAITSSDLSPEEKQSCELFHELKIENNRSGTESCPTGTNSIPLHCCKAPEGTVLQTGQMCCGKVVPTQFLLVHHYTRKTSDGKTCRVTLKPQYFGDEASCKKVVADGISGFGTPQQGHTYSNYTVIKNCERVNTRSYKLPAHLADTCSAPSQ